MQPLLTTSFSVNVAGSRTAYSSSRDIFAGLATDHKVDKAFSTNLESQVAWWSVDLLVRTKIHMIRIVTAVGYKKSDFEGLELRVGEGHPTDEPNRLVAKWKPTNDIVQVMTCPRATRGRFVTLKLRRKSSILSFREVEVYNGPLIDVDECEIPGVCPKKLKCVNLPISYTCECQDGYKPRPGNSTDCLDIDECAAAKNACPLKNTYCLNTVGSYKCLCSPGYSPVYNDTKLSSCRDVDECANLSLHSCPTNHSKCINEMGSYRCGCDEGYRKLWSSEYRDQDINCIDENECESNQHNCGANSMCFNTEGSYDCSCKSGFESTSHDGRNCRDYDECANLISPCGLNEACINTAASYECSCQEGFQENKEGICEDVDECSKDNGCDKGAYCENTVGGYNCVCKEGYKKTEDGSCKETCLVDCGENSYCSHGHCSCLSGYTKDSFSSLCFPEALIGSSSSLRYSLTVSFVSLGYLLLGY